MNVTEELDASEDEELSVDTLSVSMPQISKVQYLCHSYFFMLQMVIKVGFKYLIVGLLQKQR